MDDELLTKKEVARFLKVSEATVYRMTRRGDLPAIRRGKRFTRIRKSDLLAFLERYTQREEPAREERQ